MKTMRTTFIFALFAFAIAALAGPYDAWTQNRAIRLNTGVTGANVAGNVTGFPVLIRLTPAESTIFVQAKAGGADLRFSKTNDSILRYQIERWDATARRAEIWVKVDTVKGNDSAQSIRMFWGNAAATSESNGAAVFDSAAGYLDVWHLGDAAGTAARPNAVAGGLTATPVSFAAGYQPRAGAIGLADSLSGGSNADSTSFLRINEGTATTRYNFPQGSFTYTAWIRPTVIGNFPRLISLVSEDAGVNRIFVSFSGGNLIGRVWGTASHPTNSSVAPPVGQWQHVAMTVSRGPEQDTTRLYHNGAEVAMSVHNPMPDAERNYVRIGKDYINTGSDETYNGLVDEARLSRVTRSADYVKLSWASQGVYQKFTNIGVTVVSVPGAPTGVVATPSNTTTGAVTVSWAAPASDGGSPITGYTVTSNPGSATCAATPPTLSCAVTGLTVGTPYTFTVRATNTIGLGPVSAVSAQATPVLSIRADDLSARRTGDGGFVFGLAAGLAAAERATLVLTDVHGRTVWSKTVHPARDRVSEIAWNGRVTGGKAATGAYLARLIVVDANGTTEAVRRLVPVAP